MFKNIYIHLPFCEVICHYCDFYTARSKEADHERLINAIVEEANTRLPQIHKPVDSIYFGGGTPSVTPPHLLEDILKLFSVHQNTEITLEANPTNINQENLMAWKKMGINRLSIGVQSLNDKILRSIGRVHSMKDAIDAVRLAKKHFENVSCDLMYGIPEQTTDDILAAAEILTSLKIKHLSAYHLTLEETHFWKNKLPESDRCYEQIEALYLFLENKGLQQYEVSNFAIPGFSSRHNQSYWQNKPYLGLGPSAHSFDGKNRRWKNTPHWKNYCEQVNREEETLSQEQLKIEYLFTHLRTTEGIQLQEFRGLFGVDLTERIKTMKIQGLIEDQPSDYLRLSFKGRMLGDEIVKNLL